MSSLAKRISLGFWSTVMVRVTRLPFREWFTRRPSRPLSTVASTLQQKKILLWEIEIFFQQLQIFGWVKGSLYSEHKTKVAIRISVLNLGKKLQAFGKLNWAKSGYLLIKLLNYAIQRLPQKNTQNVDEQLRISGRHEERNVKFLTHREWEKGDPLQKELGC